MFGIMLRLELDASSHAGLRHKEGKSMPPDLRMQVCEAPLDCLAKVHVHLHESLGTDGYILSVHWNQQRAAR